MRSRVMARFALMACLCLAVLSGIGCGSKGPMYPEEHARYVNLDHAIDAFRDAYTRKDLARMEALMLPSEALDRMMMDVMKDFEQYQEISLDFSIERVLIEGDQIDVFLHWQGQWKRNEAESGVRDRGHGLLRWTGDQFPLLSGIGGDLPFGMATRHAVPQIDGSR